MSRVCLRPEGPFALAASIRFLEGFTPAAYQSESDDTLDLAFPVDGDWRPAAVRVRQRHDGVVEALVGGDGNLDAVHSQLARILGLDVDGQGFTDVGDRDPVVADLQARRPGFRPVAFCSPYEAAAWAIISQRVHMGQAARVKADLARQLGQPVIVEGRQLHPFPGPARLQRLDSFPGLTQRKTGWLRALAAAALECGLRADDLRSTPTGVALASLQRLPGIGPFGAELVLARGAAHPDVLPANERRLRLAVQHAYNLQTTPSDKQLAVIAETWRPYRTWVTALLRAGADPLRRTT